MAKHYLDYQTNNQSAETFRGCMWGIFYALDYHHWQNNVRKMLPHRRHNKRKSSKQRNKNQKKITNANDVVQNLMEAEASPILVNQQATETSSTHKRSLKARIKALVAEKIRKEHNNNKQGLNFSVYPQLGRSLSINHLESSGQGFSKNSNEWKSPIIFFPRKATPGVTKLQHPARMTVSDWKNFEYAKEDLMDYIGNKKHSQNYTFLKEKRDGARGTSLNQAHANQLMQNASRRQLKERVDVLELFQVNEELFQEFQQNNGVGEENIFQIPKASNAKARLTKSGTFPVANAPYPPSRNFKPSKLEDKQSEIWPFPRGVMVRSSPQETETDIIEDSGRSSGTHALDSSEDQLPPLGSIEDSIDLRDGEVATHMEDDRQRLEPHNHDINELSCSSSTSLLDQVSNGIYNNRDILDQHLVNDSLVYDFKRSTKHRRAASLNDSLHRYARLFDYSFGKTNWALSKSTRLTSEYMSLSGRAPISFERNRSLPHDDFNWPLQEDLSPDVSSMIAVVGTKATEENTSSESKPIGLLVTENTKTCLLLDTKEENLQRETVVENIKCSPEVEYLESLTVGFDDWDTAKIDEHWDGINEVIVEQTDSHEDLHINSKVIDDKMAPEIRPASEDEVANTAEFSESEGLEHTDNFSRERESTLSSVNSSDADFVSQSSSTTSLENVEKPRQMAKKHIHTKSHTDEDADLNYVREILEMAGFRQKGFPGEWYSSEQPLSPLIFDEVEECWWPHESECSQENLILLDHHQLLFDLINEVILQIYEKSYTYYPKALSSSCHVHPLKSQEEEVLKTIGKLLSYRPEEDHSSDEAVRRDLTKDDGWMNLQTESECVALELEDAIFDELLEELICC